MGSFDKSPAEYQLAAQIAKAEPEFIPPSVRHAMLTAEQAYLLGYRQALANHQRDPRSK